VTVPKSELHPVVTRLGSLHDTYRELNCQQPAALNF
jgi:hypothetical protein